MPESPGCRLDAVTMHHIEVRAAPIFAATIAQHMPVAIFDPETHEAITAKCARSLFRVLKDFGSDPDQLDPAIIAVLMARTLSRAFPLAFGPAH